MSELCFGYCMCSAKLRKDYTRALKNFLYKKNPFNTHYIRTF